MNMAPSQLRKGTPLTMLREIVSEFREFGPHFTMQQAEILIHMSLLGGNEVRMTDLVKMTGISQAGISRNCAKLGQISYKRTGSDERADGYDLLRADIDPNDWRKKVVSLTPKGRKLIDRLITKLED
jgi:DNA-binding MarR family transcriptional regulator